MDKKHNKLASSVLYSVQNKVPESVLSQVITDWQGYFFNLNRYKKSQKLLFLEEPTVFGIELEKYSSDSYRPRIVLYNLIDSNSKFIAVVDQTIKNKKELDITIKYTEHSTKYLEACNLLNRQSKINLFKKPTIDDIIDYIIFYIENNCLGNPFWSCQAIMQMSHLLNNQQKRNAIFEKAIMLLREKVPDSLLEIQTNGFEEWIENMRDLTIENINEHIKISKQKYGFIS